MKKIISICFIISLLIMGIIWAQLPINRLDRKQNKGLSVKGRIPEKTVALNHPVNAHQPMVHNRVKSIIYNKFPLDVYLSPVNLKPSIRKQLHNTSDYVLSKTASLHIPAGAMPAATRLSIVALDNMELPPLDANLVNVTIGGGGFRFLPHGTIFAKQVIVSISYDKSLIPEGYTEADLCTFYYNTQSKNWQMLPKDTLVEGKLLSYTTHFTDMITGILKVPETPATSAYVPTTMSDIKAANPSAKIEQIQPPQANNSGSADLQYPLDLPQGRLGITPAISFTYSSNNGDSWLGTGWNLNIPSIEVESRWGVPLFLPDKETETYLIQGGQLSPVAHREEWTIRTAEKQFYPRVEGTFQKIIRHGDGPKNYWWEVTSTTGQHSYYGGIPSKGLIENALLKDIDGNIAKWCLVQSADLHNNTVNYYYKKNTESNYKGTGETATSQHLQSVAYTGLGDTDGVYTITFVTDADLGQAMQNRVQINAHSGYLHKEQELLKKININFQGKLMRSYNLVYINGVFEHQLLQKVETYDADGILFYSHTFDYYKDTETDYFGAEQAYTPPNDDLNAGFINPIETFSDKMSAIGGTKSSGFNVGGSVSIGPNAGVLKQLTVGGTYGYSSSSTQGISTLVDINGDGIPDKIYKKGGTLWYRPGVKDNPQIFGNAIRLLNAPSDFSHTKNSTNSIGISANFFVTGGYDKSTTNSTTDIFISDFNSDGLPDIAYKGLVYFNVLRNGQPTFEPSSDNTFNPVYSNSQSPIDPSLFPDPVALTAQQAEQNPIHNSVRVWKAPYTGTINIDAPVQLLAPTATDQQTDGYDKRDGVRVSIQKESILLWSDIIEKDDYNLQPCHFTAKVNKGDRVFMRLQSKTNGIADHVEWNPLISYSDINGNRNDTLLKSKDVNNFPYTVFSAGKEFTLWDNKPIVFSKDGMVKLEIPFQKAAISDTLYLKIYYKPDSLTTTTETLFHQEKYAPHDLINTHYTYNTHAGSGGHFRFLLKTESDIDWSKISATAHLTYTSLDDGSSVRALDGSIQYEYYGLFGADLFHNTAVFELPYRTDTAVTMKIMPVIKALKRPLVYNDTLDFTLKNRKKVFYQAHLNYTDDGNAQYWRRYGDNVDTSYIISKRQRTGHTLTLQAGDTLFAYYRSKCAEYAKNLDFAGYAFIPIDKNGTETTDTIYVKACLNLPGTGDNIKKNDACNSDYNNIPWMGRMYRNWGSFAYNEQATYSTDNMDIGTIDADIAKLASSDVGGVHEGMSETEIETISDAMYKPEKARYLNMTGSGQHFHREGFMENCYVAETTQGACRFGMQDVLVEPFTQVSGAFPTISKKNQTINKTKSLGASIGPISGSKCWSDSETKFDIDLMDLNGDGYPDIYSMDKIQYTGPMGGMRTNKAIGFDRLISTGSGQTYSVSMSGKPAKLGTLFSKSKKSDEAAREAATSVSIRGSMGTSNDQAQVEWIDINADGLPDRVYLDGTVELNMGYRFAKRTLWSNDNVKLTRGQTNDYGAGLGVSLFNNSITMGISLSRSENHGLQSMTDLNGDGLPDRVSYLDEEHVSVSLNRGADFAQPQTLSINPLPKGVGTGESVNGSFSIVFPILFLKVCIGVDAGAQHGVSRERHSFQDMNGDGYPDMVTSDQENLMKVRYAQMGRMNLLKKVGCPMGARYYIDYTRTFTTQDDPSSHWTMTELKVFDGLVGDGVDTLRKSFSYAAPHHDRYERTFTGFNTVVSNDLTTDGSLYRYTTEHFFNGNIYEQGLLKEQTLQAADGTLISSMKNTYRWVEPASGQEMSYSAFYNGRLWPQLQTTNTTHYEGSQNINIQKQYQYDTYGNVTLYTESTPLDGLQVNITYINNENAYLHALPTQYTLTSEGPVLRKRKANYTDAGNIANLIHVNGDHDVTFDFEYDVYGNITKVTRPANYKGQRLWYAIDYDPVHHHLPIMISDAYGYKSTTEYDLMWKLPLVTTDINGEQMHYLYDRRGRPTAITGPYGIAPELQFYYHPEATVPYATTYHQLEGGDTLRTYSFTDGLERMVELKKTTVIDQGHEVMQVSSQSDYNEYGEQVTKYLPIAEERGTETTYNRNRSVYRSTTQYDVQGRVLKETLPDGAVTATAYAIENGLLSNTITNAEGQLIKLWQTVRQQKVKQQQEDAITLFKYNVLSELEETTDPNGNKSTCQYDMLGRLISSTHPDAGTTSVEYDDAGNRLKLVTANTASWTGADGVSKAGIAYSYNYEQPFEVVYPKNVQNRITYTYGKPGEAYGRVGRVALVQDASGGQEFYYGKLGEVVKTIRSVMANATDVYTYIWESSSDSWGRVRSMTYPDGEKVIYRYNKSGELLTFVGEKNGYSYPYLRQRRYDLYGHTVYELLGDSTLHTYTYDPSRQRLSTMQLTKSDNEQLMYNTYRYDKIDNVLGISDARTTHTYRYDRMNRLVNATGRSNGQDYTLDMTYDKMGNILQKNQHSSNQDISNQLTYSYGGTQPNAVLQVGNKHYTYDGCGNPTLCQDGNVYRRMVWDEDNRLQSVVERDQTCRYVYDATGERCVKNIASTSGVSINGAPMQTLQSQQDATWYVSPYFTVGKNGNTFTKHFFAGTTRIASKIGTGQFVNKFRAGNFGLTAGSINYINRMNELNAVKQAIQSTLPPGPPHAKGINSEPEYTGIAYADGGTPQNTYTPAGWPRRPIGITERNNATGVAPGPPIVYGTAVINATARAGEGFYPAHLQERNCYFYHSDHLGSTSYVTLEGKVSQFVVYLPFGETLLEEHSNTHDMPYLFTAKERDGETGLYYYGARYYDPKTSLWLGVDPLAEKKPWISPYAFCAGNPVNLIDPDGMDWYKWTGENGKEAILWQEGNAKTLDLNGQTYNNVGENYSYTLGNTTYSFEQQKMVSMSVAVLDNNQFQTQFDSRFGDEKRQKVACKRACDVMESNAGVTSAGRNDATQQVGREIGTADNHSIVPTTNQANGDKTLVRDVELNGNPVIVGVDRGKHGRGINDGTTDHWIVVSGYTYNLTNGTTSYNYFDPGNRNAAQGTNAANVLMRTNNGLLTTPNRRPTYTVTNIRPNR